jgi:biopolymer transport protein ExbD
MTQHRFFILLAIAASLGCQLPHSKIKGGNKLSCILLGHDSIAWYYGPSAQMAGLEIGKITDTLFLQAFIRSAKDQMGDSAFVIILKPTASDDVLPNMEMMVDKLNKNDLQRRDMGALDDNEKKKFNAVSWQMQLDMPKPRQLVLPEGDGSQSPYANAPVADRLVLLFNQRGIYAYPGDDMSSGKTYTYPELIKMLTAQKSNPRLTILIKPAARATYRNTVDVLDAAVQSGIKKYALIDITPAEEEYLQKHQQPLSL